MAYQSENLIAQVREVREASGVSQRALSERAGLTQSHISQIESGKMEPGLSSFIDLTRALDLEVMLVPKKLVSAVLGLVKAQATPDMHIHAGQLNDKRFARAERLVKKMKHLYGSSADLDRIEDTLRFLRRANLSDQEMQLVRELIARLERYQSSVQAAPILHDIAQNLQRLRNSIAHPVPSEPRAAYSLDDGDADA
ncbi:transcriptional regulator with XRE-family HTH domain [Mesorhizobium sp. USDA 4775]|uniref:helix-turn-helix domain-containing protein n=1 Tax=Mesorhizobium jarvisii TaxID=1777867 RepID=UPI00049B5803|nr:helix-turn-helix transcriptional regulator [Mesorhizobium jarvisii]AID34623.1 helix-turn-helix domain-containing protein [Mesorhizobium huakuii 7653R]MCH4561266.1 helix-turn-helix transcriptional regulator [Mesorhizobium jarvisii]